MKTRGSNTGWHEGYAVISGQIYTEALDARAKFGDQFDLTSPDWLAVLTEEVGEAARELNERKLGNYDPNRLGRLRAEVTQIGAVALRWIALLDLLMDDASTPIFPDPVEALREGYNAVDGTDVSNGVFLHRNKETNRVEQITREQAMAELGIDDAH